MPRLRRSDLSGPGIRRMPGPRYLDPSGRSVTDPEVLHRIEALVIPPAWQDVWISPDPRGHIQAVGVDDAGRRQYLYHDEWRARRDREKFDLALLLARALPSARRGVTRDLARDGFARERALAAAFRLIDLSSLRIGSEQYLRDNGSRGLTTLQVRHLVIAEGAVRLEFPGKSGQPWHSVIDDDAVTRYLDEVSRARGTRARLLSWRDRRWHSLTTAAVNEDIQERTKAEITAKDFRTLRGTIIAATELARVGLPESKSAADRAVTRAIAAAADVLGNTPAVARSSYVDPRIFDRYREGALLDTRRSAERALLALLG
jgi:DNA topoisomerase-1